MAAPQFAPADLLGSATAFTNIMMLARRWAATTYPLLLRGERGTGKSALAAWLHELSGRPGPCVEISLAQLADGLEGDDLRGHVRGSFTGAVHRRVS